MKPRILKVLLGIETFVIVLAIVWVGVNLMNNKVNSKMTELFREISPDGNYLLIIQEMGTPDWPFGADHLRITLYENKDDNFYRASLKADVSNDGGTAYYEVEWLEDGVQIALSGSGQVTAYYILPFKTLED